MSQITVQLKVDDYLKDYLISSYGEEGNIISFPERSDLSLRVRSLLNKQPNEFSRIEGSFVEVKLPFSDTKDPRVYNYLSANSQKIISRDVYYEFYAVLHRHMKEFEKSMLKEEAFWLFYEMYNIDLDHIKFETLKKNFYRFMQKKVRKTIINFRDYKVDFSQSMNAVVIAMS